MFLTLVEDKSRMTWIYLLSDKSVVPALIKEFVALVRTQFNVTIKALRTDNGTEFCNKIVDGFPKDSGIIHQLSCVYIPQQNELVERKHMHLLNCARALRFRASLPIRFWGDYILTAAYLINKTPFSVLGNKSPFELLFQEIPDYDTRKVFGKLCYATVVPQPTDKFAARANKGVFLGYPYGKKGYKVYNLDTHIVFISRDVRFIRIIFPFRNIDTPSPHMLFPQSSQFVADEPLIIPTSTEEVTHEFQLSMKIVLIHL